VRSVISSEVRRRQGVVPKCHEVPMHLLLQLDMRDPLVPVESEVSDLTYLPLYYPLRYGFGGGNVQYSVDSDDQITILSPLHEEKVDDGREHSFPVQFPQLPVTLTPLAYRHYRAIVMAEHGSNHYKDDPPQKADFALQKEIDTQRMIRLGKRFTPIQGDVWYRCENPRCRYKGKSMRADVFAQFTDSLTSEISIWSGPGHTSLTEIYFALLPCCSTIITENQCT